MRTEPGVIGHKLDLNVCPQCQTELQKAVDVQVPLRCVECGLPLRLIGERYRIVSLLNEGSFAWIYKALDVISESQEERAVKVFKAGVLDELTTKLRFFREVNVTTKLGEETPHIVQMHGVSGIEDELGCFYVMELLNGASMDEHMLEDASIDYDLSFHIVEQVCEALQIAHQNGVVHRDIKPENIFLTETQDDPYFVKLIDFGIAKRSATQHLYLTQNIVGTPAYMSPEQCLNAPIDGRSDQYAVAVLLFRCLTGYIPFDITKAEYPVHRRRMLAIMDAHLNEQPRSMLEVSPDLSLSPELDQVLLRALSKEPEERYPSMQDFWDAVAPFRGDDPTAL